MKRFFLIVLLFVATSGIANTKIGDVTYMLSMSYLEDGKRVGYTSIFYQDQDESGVFENSYNT